MHAYPRTHLDSFSRNYQPPFIGHVVCRLFIKTLKHCILQIRVMLLYNYILVEVNMYGISVLEFCCVFAYKNMNKTFQFLKSTVIFCMLLIFYMLTICYTPVKWERRKKDIERRRKMEEDLYYSCLFFAIVSSLIDFLFLSKIFCKIHMNLIDD